MIVTRLELKFIQTKVQKFHAEKKLDVITKFWRYNLLLHPRVFLRDNRIRFRRMAFLIFLCLFGNYLFNEIQINAPGDSIVGFWPGDYTMTSYERCAIATTKSQVFRIQNGVVKAQTIPNMTASAVIYNSATTAYWYALANEVF